MKYYMNPLESLYTWDTPWMDSPSDVKQVFMHLPMKMLEIKSNGGWIDAVSWSPYATYRMKMKRQHTTKHQIYMNDYELWYYDEKNIYKPLSENTPCVGFIYYHPERNKYYYYSKNGDFQVAEKNGDYFTWGGPKFGAITFDFQPPCMVYVLF